MLWQKTGRGSSIQARQKGHTFHSHCVRFAVAAGPASVRYFHLVSCFAPNSLHPLETEGKTSRVEVSKLLKWEKRGLKDGDGKSAGEGVPLKCLTMQNKLHLRCSIMHVYFMSMILLGGCHSLPVENMARYNGNGRPAKRWVPAKLNEAWRGLRTTDNKYMLDRSKGVEEFWPCRASPTKCGIMHF